MRAGALRTPLWIQSVTETKNAIGEITVTYTNVQRWRAKRLGASGDERLAGQQVHGTRAVTWEGRFIPSLSLTGKYVLYDGTVRYDIDPPFDPDGKRERLHITAVQRAA